MKRVVVLGSFAALGLGSILLALGACSSSSGGGGGGGVHPDTGTSSDTSVNNGDTSTNPDDTSTNPDDTSTTDETSTTGDTSTTEGGVACPVSPKTGTIASFNTPGAGAATKGDGIHLSGVIATSQKFQVEKSKTTGVCLYGVFVADPNATFMPYSGILVVSKGTNVQTSDSGATFCSDGDLIPNDVAPGDVLDLIGVYSPQNAPSAATCGAGTPPEPEPNPAVLPEIAQLCQISKTGTGTVPAAAKVANIGDLIGGTNLTQWAAGLVEVDNVTATTSSIPGDSSFGVFQVETTGTSGDAGGDNGAGLKVGDTIYFRGKSTSPTVPKGTTFNSITGLEYLDFCSWTLEPNNSAGFNPVGNAFPDAGAGDAATGG